MNRQIKRYVILFSLIGLVLVVAACAPLPVVDTSEVQELRAQVTSLETQVAQMQPKTEAGVTADTIVGDEIQARMSDLREQLNGLMQQDPPDAETLSQVRGQMQELMTQMHSSLMGDGMEPDAMIQMMGMMSHMAGMMDEMQGMMGDGMGQPGAMANRQAEVAERGAQVMPFDLEKTIHVFTNLDNGGLQQVVVKEGGDADQVRLIQMHLSQEAVNFRAGNFSDPAQIHGDAMPGLALLREQADAMDIRFTPLDNGAQLEYISDNPELIAAIHDWFDAQLSDHGMDATNALPPVSPAQSPAAQTPAKTGQLTQSSAGGGVTAQVTPLALMDKMATTLDFEIALNTHAVVLDADLAKTAVLLVNGWEIVATDWQAPASGGHHVSGRLSFPATGSDGKPILDGAKSLSLVIRDLAGVSERVFTWDLGDR